MRRVSVPSQRVPPEIPSPEYGSARSHNAPSAQPALAIGHAFGLRSRNARRDRQWNVYGTTLLVSVINT